MIKILRNTILFYLLLAVFTQPAITINYFFLGALGLIYLAAALSGFLTPGRGLLAICYVVPFYLIQQTVQTPGHGWLVLHNIFIVTMVLLTWQDESFLTPPYLSPESPYRELDLAVPFTIFFYVASLIVIPALGPKLVNWNSVQRSALVAFEALFFYFVITRYFTEELQQKRLTVYLTIAFLAITAWGGFNLFNTHQSINRTRFYLNQNKLEDFSQAWEKTYEYNKITNSKKIKKELEELAQ